MAPEMHQNLPYEGQKMDVFAAGIILFQMVTSHLPFETAEPSDPIYRSIAAGRFDVFWSIHTNFNPKEEIHFSDDFKHLMQSMLALEYEKRPTVCEVLNHPWIKKGKIPTTLQVFAEFTIR